MSLRAPILAAYAAPALPLAALYFPVFVFLSEFYAAERGLSLTAIGAVMIGVRLFDAVSDPVIGVLSDATPARLRRRKLWLVLALPVIVLAAWRIFVPPMNIGIGYFAWWLLILTLGWTMALTPYFAWGAELMPDYDGRTKAAFWRESAGLVGTILAAVLNALNASPRT